MNSVNMIKGTPDSQIEPSFALILSRLKKQLDFWHMLYYTHAEKIRIVVKDNWTM